MLLQSRKVRTSWPNVYIPLNVRGVWFTGDGRVSELEVLAESADSILSFLKLQETKKTIKVSIKMEFLIRVKLSAFKDAYFILLLNDKRTNSGFKGQSNVAEEASLTSIRNSMN